jgi:hypothetical protein
MDNMDASSAAPAGVTLTASFEKLLLSSVRLSSAATLFGVYQLESAVSGFREPGGLGRQLARFGGTVNSLAACLLDEISRGKKDALDSFADISGKVVRQSMEGISYLDPRRVARIANKLAQRPSGSSKDSGTPESSRQGEPQLATDVLSG